MLPIDPHEFREILSRPGTAHHETSIIVHYHITPSEQVSVEEAAARIAIITQLRTIAPQPHEDRKTRLKHLGHVIDWRPTGEVTIGYPNEICSRNEGIAQLLVAICAGCEYNYTKSFWVDEIELPNVILERFQGPSFGVDGVRKIFGIPTRPLIGAIVGPRDCNSLTKTIELCRKALLGGADFIADDLLMVDPDGEMAFKTRVPRLAKLAEQISAKTGEPKQYLVNVSSSLSRAKDYARIAKSEGASMLILNAFTMGFPALEEMAADISIGMPIITCNMGVGLMTRLGPARYPRESTGISEAVISKLSRIAGADAVHLAASSSECYAPTSSDPGVVTLRTPLLDDHIRPSFAVAEGALTLANIWDSICSLGPDVMLEANGSILGYADGPEKGARAFRTLVEHLSYDMSPDEAHKKIMDLYDRDPVIRRGLEAADYRPST